MGAMIHRTRPAPHVALLAIDNPPMNALGRAARAALLEALDAIDADGETRVVILTGHGTRAFCSGDDLKEQAEAQKAKSSAHLAEFARVLERIEGFRLPVIAAGFVCSGVNVGLMASAYRLPRLIGVARAKHMLLTGSPVDAAKAELFGLVTAVHAPEVLMAEALALAGRIASRAPLSVEATKRTAALAPDLTPEEAATVNAKELSVLGKSADHREALAAFAEKREPVFRRG